MVTYLSLYDRGGSLRRPSRLIEVIHRDRCIINMILFYSNSDNKYYFLCKIYNPQKKFKKRNFDVHFSNLSCIIALRGIDQ